MTCVVRLFVTSLADVVAARRGRSEHSSITGLSQQTAGGTPKRQLRQSSTHGRRTRAVRHQLTIVACPRNVNVSVAGVRGQNPTGALP